MSGYRMDRRTPWTLAGIVLCSAAAIAAAGGEFRREIVFGMLGPLVAIGGTWALVEYTRSHEPGKILSRLIVAFVAKAVFLAVYTIAVIKGIGLDPGPFAISFAGYFVVFYGLEALHLKRIQPGGALTINWTGSQPSSIDRLNR